MIAGVDPISLGVLAPPGELGIGHRRGHDPDARRAHERRRGRRRLHRQPGRGALRPRVPDAAGEHLRDDRTGRARLRHPLFEQTSYGAREEGNDWTGNSVYMWAVANAAYMAAMGPQGFAEVGHVHPVQRSHYAAARLAAVPGLSVRFPHGFFREFVVDFSGDRPTVAEINAALRERGIFGGLDLSRCFPELGQSALYCVTEIHTQPDIDRLADALAR